MVRFQVACSSYVSYSLKIVIWWEYHLLMSNCKGLDERALKIKRWCKKSQMVAFKRSFRLLPVKEYAIMRPAWPPSKLIGDSFRYLPRLCLSFSRLLESILVPPASHCVNHSLLPPAFYLSTLNPVHCIRVAINYQRWYAINLQTTSQRRWSR